MGNEMENKIERIRLDLEEHKRATALNLQRVERSIDDRLERITAMAKEMLPKGALEPVAPHALESSYIPAVEWDSSITATPENNFETEQTQSAIFMATNGYRFQSKDGNPPGTFVTVARKGRTGIIRFKRDVKGQKDSFGNPINSFVPAFPAFVAGSFNGREATGFYDNPQLPGIKRQYNYPAFDLRNVANRVGLPSSLRDLEEFKLRCKVAGTFYGSSAFLDLYLHDVNRAKALQGYRGTINGIDGSFTKGVNINTWFTHPSEVNTPGMANGWTGATKIADKRISGTNVQIGVKVERILDDEFLYVSVVPASSRVIDYDIKAVTQWAEEDLQQTLHASPYAMQQIATMKEKPIDLSNGATLCGGHFGSEFWYSRPGAEFDQMEFEDLEFRINGVSHFLDGTKETESGLVVPIAQKPITTLDPKPRGKTRRLRMRVNDKKALPQSLGGGSITANSGLVSNPTNSPFIMVRALEKGTGTVEWTSRMGILWSTDIVIS